MSAFNPTGLIHFTSPVLTPRDPFHYTDLPILSRLQRLAFKRRRRVARRFVTKPARALFRAARALGLRGTGRFELDIDGRRHAFTFDARNTQFTPVADGIYEPEVSALLDFLLAPDEVFFDIGSNWGYFALYVLSRPDYRGTVHAFEGYPPTFADLASIARQSPFGARFAPHGHILSDEDARVRMGLIDGGIHSGLARIGGDEESVAVEARRLDGLGLAPPAVIKLDVEGFEAQVLRGSDGILASSKPAIIFESWREPHAPDKTLAPFEVLAAHGYRFFVPTWIHETNGARIGTSATNAAPSARMGLVEIAAEHRFLLDSQLNILAYPAERMEELRRRFEGPAA